MLAGEKTEGDDNNFNCNWKIVNAIFIYDVNTIGHISWGGGRPTKLIDMPYNAFSSGLNFPASLVLLAVAVAAVARFFCSLFWFILFAYSTPAYQSNEGGEGGTGAGHGFRLGSCI